jgi:hypothetical protein
MMFLRNLSEFIDEGKSESERVLRCDGVMIPRAKAIAERLSYCASGDCWCDSSYDEFECVSCLYS